MKKLLVALTISLAAIGAVRAQSATTPITHDPGLVCVHEEAVKAIREILAQKDDDTFHWLSAAFVERRECAPLPDGVLEVVVEKVDNDGDAVCVRTPESVPGLCVWAVAEMIK